MSRENILYNSLLVSVIIILVSFFSVIGCTKQEPDKKIIRQLTYPENLPDRMELDAQHRAVHDSTKWGEGETKPWEERYKTDESKTPYQGGVGNSKNN